MTWMMPSFQKKLKLKNVSLEWRLGPGKLGKIWGKYYLIMTSPTGNHNQILLQSIPEEFPNL